MDVRQWWAPGDGGISVWVRVQPGARGSEVVGVSDDGRLRVRVRAAAHEGKANAELERVLAAAFGVKRSAVSITKGQQAREKRVWIAGILGPPRGLLDAPA
jgi:hypothetical protein